MIFTVLNNSEGASRQEVGSVYHVIKVQKSDVPKLQNTAKDGCRNIRYPTVFSTFLTTVRFSGGVYCFRLTCHIRCCFKIFITCARPIS